MFFRLIIGREFPQELPEAMDVAWVQKIVWPAWAGEAVWIPVKSKGNYYILEGAYYDEYSDLWVLQVL